MDYTTSGEPQDNVASPDLAPVRTRPKTKAPLSFEEQRNLAFYHAELGPAWSAIAALMPNRTENDVKNMWHSTVRGKNIQRDELLLAYARAVQVCGDEPEARYTAFSLAQERIKAAKEAGGDSAARAAAGGEWSPQQANMNAAASSDVAAANVAGIAASPFTAMMAIAATGADALKGGASSERHASSSSSPTAARQKAAPVAAQQQAAGNGAAASSPLPVPAAADEPCLQQQPLAPHEACVDRRVRASRLGLEESHQSEASLDSRACGSGAAAAQQATEAFAQLQLTTAAAGSHAAGPAAASQARQPGVGGGAAGLGASSIAPSVPAKGQWEVMRDHEETDGSLAAGRTAAGGTASKHRLAGLVHTAAAAAAPGAEGQATPTAAAAAVTAAAAFPDGRHQVAVAPAHEEHRQAIGAVSTGVATLHAARQQAAGAATGHGHGHTAHSQSAAENVADTGYPGGLLPHSHAAAAVAARQVPPHQQPQHDTAAALASGVRVAFPRAGSYPTVAHGGAHGSSSSGHAATAAATAAARNYGHSGGTVGCTALDVSKLRLFSAGTVGTTAASCGSLQLGNTGCWAAASPCSAASSATLSCGGLNVAFADAPELLGSDMHRLLLPRGSAGLSGQQQQLQQQAVRGASSSGLGGAAAGERGAGQPFQMQPHKPSFGSIGSTGTAWGAASAGGLAEPPSAPPGAAGALSVAGPPPLTSAAAVAADVASGSVGGGGRRGGGGGNAGADVLAEMDALDAMLSEYIDPGAGDAPELASYYLDAMDVDLFPQGLMEAATVGMLVDGGGNGAHTGAAGAAAAGTVAVAPAVRATAAGGGSGAAAAAAAAVLGAPQHRGRSLVQQPASQRGGAMGAAAPMMIRAGAGLASYTVPGSLQWHAGDWAGLAFTQSGPLPRTDGAAQPEPQPPASLLPQQLQPHQQPHWPLQQQRQQQARPPLSQHGQLLLLPSPHQYQQQQARPPHTSAPLLAAETPSSWEHHFSTAGGVHVVDCCNVPAPSPRLLRGPAAGSGAAPASASVQGFVACVSAAAHTGAGSSQVLNGGSQRGSQFHDAYAQLEVARRARGHASLGAVGPSSLRAGSSNGGVAAAAAGFMASPRSVTAGGAAAAERLQHVAGLTSRPASAALQPRHLLAAAVGAGGSSNTVVAPASSETGVLDDVLGVCSSLRLPALTDAATTLGLGEEDLQDVFRGI